MLRCLGNTRTHKHSAWHRAAHLCQTEKEENSQKGRSGEAQTATREECQMHMGTNVATKHLGECEGKRYWFLSPQARCTCWVAPNASHMQDAYQDRSLPRSPLASTLPLFPTGKTYLVWVLRVLFLREKKRGEPFLFIPEIKSLQGWDLELPGKGDVIGAQGRWEFPGGGKEGSGVTKAICSCPSPCWKGGRIWLLVAFEISALRLQRALCPGHKGKAQT